MGVTGSTEIERKYVVREGAAMPDLSAVRGVRSAEPAPPAPLDAVYVDTDDRALLAARIAVRRRTGGHDAGWHVKLPAAAGRIELHAPIDPDRPDRLPPELARLLFSRVRDRPLEPIARIRTDRRAVVVRDAHGGGVEVVDDRVAATDVAAGTVRSWREWEAEQVGEPGPSAALLDRIERALRAAGATPSASPAKLAQALGSEPRPPRARATAGSMLAAAVAEGAEHLHGDVAALVRHGDPDGEGVHGLRKTVRRIRAVLALRPVAGPAGAALSEALAGLAGPLGVVRDPIVAAGIAAELLDEVPDGTPGLAAARERLVTAPRARLAPETDEVVADLLSAGAAEVYAALDDFVPDGPDAGRRPEVLVRLARQRVARAARRCGTAGADLEALHAARKAARGARFVVEAVVDAGLVGPKAPLAEAGRAARAAQDALGTHRDLALLAAALPVEAEHVALHGGNAYALGLVAASADRRARRERRRAARRIAVLRRLARRCRH